MGISRVRKCKNGAEMAMAFAGSTWKENIDRDYEKRGKENGRSGRKEQYGLVSINSTNKNERSLQS